MPRVWTDKPAVCLGGGPSLCQEDVDYVRDKARVIAINDAYLLAPWADVLYACDLKWWEWHKSPEAIKTNYQFTGQGALDFKGLKITPDKEAAKRYRGLLLLHGEHRLGLSQDQSTIHYGSNSGYQAINLAFLFGARTIVLLGYDMQFTNSASHWFGDHPDRVRSNYDSWKKNFESIAAQQEPLGFQVINCSRNTALQAFKRMSLKDGLRLQSERS